MAKHERTVAARATKPTDLSRVAMLVEVAELQSFTRAAQKLGMPKSSVSRAVSRLEEELGVVLMTRSTRKLALTEAGERYVARAREALQVLGEARDAALDRAERPRGRVRLTAPIDPGGMLAAPLAKFALAYPDIQLDLTFTSRRLDLVEEGIDLALRAGRLDDASLVGRRIGATPFRLFAAPDYLARRGTPSKLAELGTHACLLYRAPRGVARWTLTRKQVTESVEVRGPFNIDDLHFALALATAGAGIAWLPEHIGRRAVRAGELVAVLPQYATHGNALYLVHPAVRTLPRRVELLRDFLYAELRAQVATCD